MGKIIKAVKPFIYQNNSNFKLAVKDLASGMVFCNRLGSELKKMIQKI